MRYLQADEALAIKHYIAAVGKSKRLANTGHLILFHKSTVVEFGYKAGKARAYGSLSVENSLVIRSSTHVHLVHVPTIIVKHVMRYATPSHQAAVGHTPLLTAKSGVRSSLHNTEPFSFFKPTLLFTY